MNRRPRLSVTDALVVGLLAAILCALLYAQLGQASEQVPTPPATHGPGNEDEEQRHDSSKH